MSIGVVGPDVGGGGGGGGTVTGSGTANRGTKWNSASSLTNASFTDDGDDFVITPADEFEVAIPGATIASYAVDPNDPTNLRYVALGDPAVDFIGTQFNLIDNVGGTGSGTIDMTAGGAAGVISFDADTAEFVVNTFQVTGGDTGSVTLEGVTSGTAVLTAEDAAGSGTFKLPSTTGSHTLTDLDSSQTLSNKIIALTAAHGTDDTYTGLTIAGLNAGATIAQWETVYLGGSSTWLLADANGSSTYPARGLAVAAYSNTNPAIILTYGTVRNDAWNWTIAGTIYLSGTPGGLTQTPPASSGDKVQAVGYALTADIAFFDFNSTYLTVT